MGGDPGHMWGIWPLLPSPPSEIWLRIWAPGWGRLLFLHGRMGPSHIVPCVRLCASHLGIEVGLFLIDVSTCFYIYTKTLLLATHSQYKLMEKVGIFDLIWPNFGAPRWGFWPKILLKSQMPHICPGSPRSGLTLIDALLYWTPCNNSGYIILPCNDPLHGIKMKIQALKR